jgi:hypothetical protein
VIASRLRCDVGSGCRSRCRRLPPAEPRPWWRICCWTGLEFERRVEALRSSVVEGRPHPAH